MKRAREQNHTFRLIKENICTAKHDDKWVDAPNSLVKDSVSHWTNVVCGALQELASDSQLAGTIGKFVQSFEGWIAKICLEAECYPSFQTEVTGGPIDLER